MMFIRCICENVVAFEGRYRSSHSYFYSTFTPSTKYHAPDNVTSECVLTKAIEDHTIRDVVNY